MARKTIDRCAESVCTVGYVGLCPGAPGTAARAVAVLAYLLISPLQQVSLLIPVAVIAFVLGGLSVCVVLRRDGKEKDPSSDECDEVVGQWVTLVSVSGSGRWQFILTACLLFRLFDVWKPPPVSFFDRRSGAWYVMLDDVMAGICANMTTHLLLVLIGLVG